MKNDDPKPGLYRHFKGGFYRMMGAAWPSPLPLGDSTLFAFLYLVKHTETGLTLSVYCEKTSYNGLAPRLWTFGEDRPERLVIYQAQHDHSYWARPLKTFRDLVPVPESMGDQHEWRFDRVGD